jgi:hypothetical protein
MREFDGWRTRIEQLRGFAERSSEKDNHPFTMTVNAAVCSTKNFTPQVPLYL